MLLKRVFRQDLSVTATTSLFMQLPHLLCACRSVSQMSNPDLQGNLRHERLDGHGSLELVHFGEDEASAKQHIFKWSSTRLKPRTRTPAQKKNS